jgi:hypothetical protein
MREDVRRSVDCYGMSILGRSIVIGVLVLGFVGIGAGSAASIHSNRRGHASRSTTTQSITFTSTAPKPGVVGGSYTVTASGGASGNPVTFSIDPSAHGSCSISGATVTLVAVGTCVIDANQAGNASYEAATQVEQSFAVLGTQSITFGSTPPSAAVVGGTYTVTASGGASGNPVTFSIDPSAHGSCSISGATVTFVAVGTCVIDANQAGNASYEAATQVQQTMTVTASTTTAPTSGTAGFGQPIMATPSGFSAANRILDDTFSGTTLNTNNWSTVPGQLYTGPWGESTTAGGVVVNNGLTLNNTGSTYGMVDTANPATGKTLFAFPDAGFYVQVNEKTTSTANGFWPAIWFPPTQDVPSTGVSTVPEMDMFEGGAINRNPSDSCENSTTAACYNETSHSDYGGGSAYWPDYREAWTQTSDLTQNFTTYGLKFIPGVSATYYINGVEVFQQLESNPGGVVSDTGNPSYQLLITPQGAPCSGSGNNGWHSCGVGTGSMYISEVQVYSLP